MEIARPGTSHGQASARWDAFSENGKIEREAGGSAGVE